MSTGVTITLLSKSGRVEIVNTSNFLRLLGAIAGVQNMQDALGPSV